MTLLEKEYQNIPLDYINILEKNDKEFKEH